MPGSCGPWDSESHAWGRDNTATLSGKGSILLEAFEKMLAAMEAKLVDIERRLSDLEIDKAVEAYLSGKDERVGWRVPAAANTGAVRTQHSSPRLAHAEPRTYGKREIAMLPTHPMSNDILAEALYSKLRVEITELKNGLKVELLSELTQVIECQHVQHHEHGPNDVRADLPRNTIEFESINARRTSPSTIVMQDGTSLRVLEERVWTDVDRQIQGTRAEFVDVVSKLQTKIDHIMNDLAVFTNVRCASTTEPSAGSQESRSFRVPIATRVTPASPGVADVALDRDCISEHIRASAETHTRAPETSSITHVVLSSQDCTWGPARGPPSVSSLASTIPNSSTNQRRVTGRQGALAESWRFRETCWDAAALIGRSSLMLLPETIVVICLCLLTVGIQSCFIVIVYLSLSNSPINQDIIDGLHLWRTLAGHDIRFTNPWTSESLASRVCRRDASLHLSEAQADRLSDIEDYLEVNWPFNGPMMCLLAMFTWILTISREFHEQIDMWIALSSLQRNCATEFDIVEGGLLPRSFHIARLLWIAFLSFVRVCISGSLLFAGCMFLCATHEIGEILLNAVALEFIINVDELLYAALAPRQTRKTVAMIKPISLPSGKQWRGLDVRIPLTTCSCIGLICAVVPLRLVPAMANMKDAKDELCKGYLKFSYGATALDVPIYAVDLSNANEEIRKLYASGKYNIIRGIIQNGEEPSFGTSKFYDQFEFTHMFESATSVEAFRRATLDFWGTTFNPSCTDVKLFRPGVMRVPAIALVALRDAVGNQTVTRCNDVAMHCNNYIQGGSIVRAICASTCKCNKPGSSLALPRTRDGCPTTCLSSRTYVKQQGARQCSQPATSLLVNDKIWREFGDSWVQATRSWSSGTSIAPLARLFVLKGCEAIRETGGSKGYLCQPSILGYNVLKSLSFWCPLYCGCNLTKWPGCPQMCEVGKPIPVGTQTPSDF